MSNFAAALDGRIRSMATTHELLSSGRSEGISLAELIRRELAPFVTRDNAKINGLEVVLRPEPGRQWTASGGWTSFHYDRAQLCRGGKL